MCELLLPHASIEMKPAPGKLGWMEFYCSTCKRNSTHNTKECTKLKARVTTTTKVVAEKQVETEKAARVVVETFNCKFCGPDKNHNTADCKRKQTKAIAYTGRSNPDGSKGEVPKIPTYLCNHCKIPGHYREWCPKV